MNKIKASFFLVCFATLPFIFGVLLGERIGRNHGYWEGVFDKSNEYLAREDSLCNEYNNRLDSLVHHSDKITIQTRTYTFK